MVEINIRDLKAHASDVLRNVSRRGQRYVVTCRGRKVGVILPVQEGGEAPDGDDAWDRLERLTAELSTRWRPGADAVRIVSRMRR